MYGIYKAFQDISKAVPQRTFIVEGEKRISYREMDRLINTLALGLKNAGVGPGSNVAYLLMNNHSAVMTFYALQKLGAFMTPFNFRFHAKEIDSYITMIGCRYFIYGPEFNAVVKAIRANHPEVTWIGVSDPDAELSWSELMESGGENWDYCAYMPADAPAVAILTGGSTGRSKAAVHTTYSMMMNQWAVQGWIYTREPVHKPDIYLMTSPLFHIGGITPLLNVVCFGGTLVFIGQFSIENIAKMVEKEKITDLMLIPPNLAQSIKNEGLDKKYDLSSVKYVAFGGGVAAPSHVKIVFDVFPDAVCELTYSQSESATYLGNYITRDIAENRPELIKATGKSVFFCDAKLVRDDGSEAGNNEVAELYGRSPSMMKGYLGQDDFPFIDGWMPTGDLFTRDDEGYYYFVDRKKDMIKSGGENVFSAEVEKVIKQLPQVSEVAVVGLPDSFFGEAVSAAIVLRPGESLTAGEVSEFCKSHIASYKKPRNIFFLSELPKTAIGKVNKIELRKELAKMSGGLD